MSKKSFQERVPREYQGIPVNFCRSPNCESFGIEEESVPINLHEKEKNATSSRQPLKRYRLSGIGKDESAMYCKACASVIGTDSFYRQVYHTIKSNRASYEQYQKISAYISSPDERCPNVLCDSNTDPAIATRIKKAGLTNAGTQRFRCSVCQKSFTSGKAERGINRSEINKQFFKALLSKVPFRRICWIFDIPESSIYRRIDFIHRQCMRFVAVRERRLCQKQYKRMYLSTDSQVHICNWSDRKVKKNTEFYGIGTADAYSSYVLAFNFNYDETEDPNQIEEAALLHCDYELKKHNRRFARLWLQHEFEESTTQQMIFEKIPDWDRLTDDERKDALEALKVSSEDYDFENQLPHKGMAVHNEYSMIAYFLLVRRLLSGVEKTRFYLDQDAGMKTWYAAVFHDLIKQGKSDGFLVRFDKGLTVDQKQKIKRDAIKKIEDFSGKTYSTMTTSEQKSVIAKMMLADVLKAQFPESEDDCWVSNPDPSIVEPNKEVYAITDIRKLADEHQAHLLRKASLHAIDRFFAQIRRRVLMFERLISSGSNASRIWYGYSPYNPALYQKLGDIFRVYYNYCQPFDKDGRKPAMRLGLAKGPVDIEKIIYHNKYM